MQAKVGLMTVWSQFILLLQGAVNIGFSYILLLLSSFSIFSRSLNSIQIPHFADKFDAVDSHR
ncbi:hypothetical protein BCR33DRAFT_589803 [Rhizoclosmatium globosum]|uniref:Uncharacterized protein n=1 Tax=Rhizoclosmatium globosum TaxID=329046 RepID=A0A1Y2B242_9FUNG|nr:hypothetical protein BCR33DRAFT_589803 [Rhizoclosmatium globosum]|eukprot:ORY28908.1 hypothetical protein BCR33DRAFT_589803 [Rhizoclosmatium globosum]